MIDGSLQLLKWYPTDVNATSLWSKHERKNKSEILLAQLKA